MGERISIEDRRLAEAAAWRVVLTEAGVETSPAFEAWLVGSPANADAWAETQALWDLFGEHATSIEMITARRDALARVGRSQRGRLRAAQRGLVGRFWIAGAAAAVVALLGLGGLTTWYAAKPQVYHTTLGERRSVTLADGSRIALDADSQVEVRLLLTARKLKLDRGQARFDVAHDADRPFSVQVRDQTVIATGTTFNVDLIGPRIMVTLIEGKVSVLRDHKSKGAAKPRQVLARLVGGERLVTENASAQIEKIDVDEATAWESGQIIFDDEPLASAVQRVSRYAVHPVTVEGAAARLRISGVFNTGDVSTFVDTIEHAFPIRAQRNDDGSFVLSSAG
jgi:transmembrane sensor